MAKDHVPDESRIERLLEGVQDALLATERENAERHEELIHAIRGRVDILGRLNRLSVRLSRVAKALAALDAKT